MLAWRRGVRLRSRAAVIRSFERLSLFATGRRRHDACFRCLRGREIRQRRPFYRRAIHAGLPITGARSAGGELHDENEMADAIAFAPRCLRRFRRRARPHATAILRALHFEGSWRLPGY